MKHFSLSKILCAALLSLFAIAASADLAVTYFHNDLTGSPVAATNEAGAVVWRKNYTPYGEVSGKDQDNRVGYTGHQEEANGLVYAGARYYDPALGRFLSTDPVGFVESNPMSFNRYAYANNNPYKFVDPDGRSPEGVDLLPYDVPSSGGGGSATSEIIGGTINNTGYAKNVGVARGAGNSGVQANKAAGDAFAKKVAGNLEKTQSGVVQEVTVKTPSGVKTRIDIMGRDANGGIVCTECKGSATAPLTKNQAAAFPEMRQSGAVVVGNGKPGFPGGTVIPPTTVQIIRP